MAPNSSAPVLPELTIGVPTMTDAAAVRENGTILDD